MADRKISELDAATSLSDDDLFVVVDDPAGTPVTKKITVADFKTSIFDSPTLVTPTIASFEEANHDHEDDAGGGQLAVAAITGLAEFIRDTIGTALVQGSGITITVDDGADTITIDASGSGANAALSNLASVAINTALLTGAGVAAALTATAPAQGASAQAGAAATLTASAAVAGASNAGAAAGGSVTITTSAAARLTSGNANGGNIVLVTGAGIGTGTQGFVDASGANYIQAPAGTGAFAGLRFNSSNTGFYGLSSTGVGFVSGGAIRAVIDGPVFGVTSAGLFRFSNSAGDPTASPDTAIGRNAANVVEINNGSAGGLGKLLAGRVVTADADGRSITAAEKRSLFTNEGATALDVFTLPTAVAGLEYQFFVQDADGIQVTAAAGDTIRIDANVSSTAGTATSTTIGSALVLVAVNATEWVATSVVNAAAWTLA